MLAGLKQRWAKSRLTDPKWQMLFEGHETELVSLDCETTSLNVREAEILSIGAVKIREGKVLASESFYTLVKPEKNPEHASVAIHGLRPMDVSEGVPPMEAVSQLLEFIGGRPLVGYYLEYDVAILNKYVKPLVGCNLPQKQIEVSGLYYDWMLKKNPDGYVDLRLQEMLNTLNIPTLARHDALNDSITAAMIYLTMMGRQRR